MSTHQAVLVRDGAGAQAHRSRGRARIARSTTTGVRVDRLMPFETWRDPGARLGVDANATSWSLEDWITFAGSRYGRHVLDAAAGAAVAPAAVPPPSERGR